MSDIKQKQPSAVKPLLKYIKPYSWMIVISLILAVVSVVLTLYAPILMGHGIDKIIAEKQVDFDGIAPILVKLGIIVAITGISQWLMTLCTNKISYLAVRDIRSDAFSKLQKLP